MAKGPWSAAHCALCECPVTVSYLFLMHSKTTQRNKQIAMGRKKFNMDPKKVREHFQLSDLRERSIGFHGSAFWTKVVMHLMEIRRVGVKFLSKNGLLVSGVKQKYLLN